MYVCWLNLKSRGKGLSGEPAPASHVVLDTRATTGPQLVPQPDWNQNLELQVKWFEIVFVFWNFMIPVKEPHSETMGLEGGFYLYHKMTPPPNLGDSWVVFERWFQILPSTKLFRHEF